MPRSVTQKKKVITEEKKANELEHVKLNLEIQKLRLEEDKAWFEFHKHMTTLNTGVIIIIATLVEKVFTHIASGSFSLIAASFYAFLGSITLSAIGLGYHMPSLRIVRATTNKPGKGSVATFFILKYARAFLFIASLIGFLLGIFFFIAFSLGNALIP